MNVLIADDDRCIRVLMREIVKELGHDVFEASDGAEAVDIATSEPVPDLILLDFLMPRLSGIEVLKAIRHQGIASPVVMVSAVSEASLRDLDGRQEADGFLDKPFHRTSIQQMIDGRTAMLRRRISAAWR